MKRDFLAACREESGKEDRASRRLQHASRVRSPTLVLLLLLLAGAATTVSAITPNEWKFRQTVSVPAGGLIRLNLPPETLNAAQPDLDDLRLLDPGGAEVPFLLERPVPAAMTIIRPKNFRAEIAPGATTLTVETGSRLPIRALGLEAAGSDDFIKAARVEGSHDGKSWQILADRQPVFRARNGEATLRLPIAPAVWEFLRVTIDDARTTAVPFTAVYLQSGGIDAPAEPLAVTITSRDESPGLTRLALNLGAANLIPASLQIRTAEQLFTRNVTVAVPTVEGEEIKEKTIANGVVYRVQLDGKDESRLEIPIDLQVPSREMLLLISNGDSPPLAIEEIRGQRRLLQLTFLAQQQGDYQLLVGNKQTVAPRYDLSGLSAELKRANATLLRPEALVAMPDYKPSDNLAALTLKGAPIDVAAWKFHKPVEVSTSGAHQVELDPEVLAGAARDFRDLRLVRDGKQVPFVLEHTSISRMVTLTQKPQPDKERPSLSRWSLKLPEPGLPLTRIAATAAAGVFQRDVHLFEDETSEHGDTYQRALGAATWRQVPEQKVFDHFLEVNAVPTTDTLTLETDNGDNPAVELRGFAAYYPVTRLVFAAANDTTEPISLYYGNQDAAAPRYDVNLVAAQLLSADRETATAGPQEGSSGGSAVAETLTGARRYIFWGVLGLAVVVLLVVIARMLPKTEQN